MKPGTVDTVGKTSETNFVRVMKKSPGSRGCYFIAEPKGEYTAFVLCEGGANADAYVASPDPRPGSRRIADRAATPALQMQREES